MEITLEFSQQGTPTLRIHLEGCGTKDKEVDLLESKNVIRVKFAANPNNIPIFVYLNSNTEVLWSLNVDDAGFCPKPEGHVWWYEKWFAGTINFPEEQGVEEVKMMASSKAGNNITR